MKKLDITILIKHLEHHPERWDGAGDYLLACGSITIYRPSGGGVYVMIKNYPVELSGGGEEYRLLGQAFDKAYDRVVESRVNDLVDFAERILNVE